MTVAGRSRRGSGNIVVHNVRRLHPDDSRLRERIPVTSVARTLLDIAETQRLQQLASAIDEAERLSLFDLRAVESSPHEASAAAAFGLSAMRYAATAPRRR